MDQPPNAVRKEHINLARLDQRGHFTGAPNRMTHRLTGAIGAREIVRFAIYCLRATLREFSSVGEGTSGSTLRTGDSRD